MKPLKVLIVSDNIDYSSYLTKIIYKDNHFRRVEIAADCFSAYDRIKNGNPGPDIVIADNTMRGCSSNSFIEIVKSNKSIKKQPVFITLAKTGTEEIIKEAFNAGTDYFIMKPFDESCIAKIINHVYDISTNHENPKPVLYNEDIYAPFRLPTGTDYELYEKVTCILNKINIPVNLKGYNYVRHAIIMVVNNIDTLGSITGFLYPDIATKFNTTRTSVERDIRTAIDCAWNKKYNSYINELFGYTIDSKKGRPTISEFIALIADKVRVDNKLI